LQFEKNGGREIEATSPLGARYSIETSSLTPSLRTPIGLGTMDITEKLDYVAAKPYEQIGRVRRACGFSGKIEWGPFWENVKRELEEIRSNIVVMHRINPYSPI